MYRHVQRADWWAAAADRPPFPMQVITLPNGNKILAVAPWAQVRWSEKPRLVHPLTGEIVDLGWLGNVAFEAAKQRAFDHFSKLLVELGAGEQQEPDWRKLLCAFWRFGPELDTTSSDTRDNDRLGPLWALLPADTRVPDHSIWEHLDLVSAFAGAFAADPQGDAALLALSIGPVQGFIAQARKLDDLWAGSHLLSRLAWETMKPLATELGPDAILFPRLRGLAQVDLWLRDEIGLPQSLFERCEWTRGASDANPLFAAALPNRFVAVVPACRARELAEKCAQAAREWIAHLGERTVRLLLQEAGIADQPDCPAYAQMREQLQGFPEVHWAAVPFSLIRCRDEQKQRDLDPSGLLSAMAPFYGAEQGKACGFLDSPAWKVLAQDIELSQGQCPVRFFSPNPGVLYPAVYDLAERVLAAAKTARPFSQREQRGWRDSLSGEVEWLTHDRARLALPPGQREGTLWARIASKRPSWAKKGEHLGALAAIKRLWPTLFNEDVSKALGREIGRYSVSTHAMALAAQLDVWLEKGGLTEGLEDAEQALADMQGNAKANKLEPVSLPRRLVLRHAKAQPQALDDARRIPALLDAAAELDESDDPSGDIANRVREAVRRTLAHAVDERLRRDFRLETYYGLLLMDGDRMGRILSGDDATAIAYRQSFHPQVRDGFDRIAADHPALRSYGEQKRAVSPGRHIAISSALNDFSQFVARHVVEEEFRGRLIYSGGDDVLATLPVADLLGCALRLRHAYSGTLPEDERKDWGELRTDRQRLHCKAGFAWLRGRLMRMMGKNATASAGVVVAHNQAPLGAVVRELRATEKAAKERGGRDALAIRVIKRAGGSVGVVLKWDELSLLEHVIAFLRDPHTSRRAVYNSLSWLDDVPDPRQNAELCGALLAYQLRRQSKVGGDAEPLAQRLLRWSLAADDARVRLRGLLQTAEFFAREVRSLEVGASEGATEEATA
ncbi:MAG TPA: type III-B CRISPR-associated protein Cas10/Cmr2 [Burkholderiaceae bacterium]|nr:type III-B CRISPR-associated protein Cas10/Cmr2 [Burkholderiaceae bacterium]